jgi:hypothetical protein
MIPNTLYNRCLKAEYRLNKSVLYLKSLPADKKIKAVISCIEDYQSILFDVMVARNHILDALMERKQFSKKIDFKEPYSSPIYRYPI